MEKTATEKKKGENSIEKWELAALCVLLVVVLVLTPIQVIANVLGTPLMLALLLALFILVRMDSRMRRKEAGARTEEQ